MTTPERTTPRGLAVLATATAMAVLLTATPSAAAPTDTPADGAPAAAPSTEAGPTVAARAADDLATTEVPIDSDGTTLHGTVITPADAATPVPGLVLVHGGGAGPRAWLRQEAEAFARAGIATLIYDKRTDGYSPTDRSYARLAEDALAAHDVLRSRRGVDADRVGLWGVSEGGWVAPLAACRADRVAFVVTVGASGVSPARQEAWAKANRLRAAGVAGSMLRTYPTAAVTRLVDAGLFPEAGYDPVPALTRLDQPVLAVWGTRDTVSPPAESMRVFAAALERGGNPHHRIRTVRNADHAGYLADEGGFAVRDWITTEGEFAPGYVELVESWVHGLRDGPPSSRVDAPPAQQTTSTPLRRHWSASAPVRLALLVLLLVGFAGYPLGSLLRRRRPAGPRPRVVVLAARGTTVGGFATVAGMLLYLATLLLTSERLIGPVLFGRALPWLVLQILAVGTLVGAAGTAVLWWRHRADVRGTLPVGLGLLLGGAALLVPWAGYWGLLVP